MASRRRRVRWRSACARVPCSSAARRLRKRAHLLRWRPRLRAQRTESTPRVQPTGAASHLDPFAQPLDEHPQRGRPRAGGAGLTAGRGEGMATTQIVAPVRGMHCAACVGKVERALTSVGGVHAASVNLATEQAAVSFDPALTTVDALRAAVARAGYELAEPRATAMPGAMDDADQASRDAALRSEKIKFVVGGVLSVPVLLGGM